MSRPLLVCLRLLEAVLLPAAAGGLLWLTGLGRWLPLVSLAGLGLVAAVAASMSTFGALVSSRKHRIALALAGTLAGLGAFHLLRYAAFLRHAHESVLLADHGRTPAEARAMVQSSLREQTGLSGPAGFLLGEFQAGTPLAGFVLSGAPLVAFRLAEALVAMGVAARVAAR